MKAVKTKTKDICKQLQVPKSTFYDWVREAKAAGTLSETPGQVSRPAPRKKAPGTGTMNRKITEQVKLKMKRLVKTEPFLTAKEIKTKIIALKDFTNQEQDPQQGARGMRSFVSPKKPMLTPDQVEFRDDWGHYLKGWGRKRWNGVLFSDETHIEIWRNTYHNAESGGQQRMIDEVKN